ncbi:MAG: hypothetical protein ACI9VR_001477, partial [Cognaticolwellia sp.]
MIWFLLGCTKALPPNGAVSTETYTQVSGVVFEFETRTLLPEAPITLHLANGTPLQLQSGADGRWTAWVPDGMPFTPELAVQGYLPARHATFVVGEGAEDQDGYLAKPNRLDLQAVPLSVFDEMASSLAGTPLRRDACLIVDTVTVAQVYAMASF